MLVIHPPIKLHLFRWNNKGNNNNKDCDIMEKRDGWKTKENVLCNTLKA